MTSSLDRIASAVAALLGVPLVLISAVDRGQDVVVGSYGAAKALHDDPSPLCREVIALGRPIMVQDTRRRLPPSARHGWGFELVAYAGVPFVLAGGGVGALAVLSPIRRTWQTRELSQLRSFAEAAGAIIDMQRSCDDLHVNLDHERRTALDVAVVTAERERVVRSDHRRTTAELQMTSVHDELTGLLNRRGLFAVATAQLEAAHKTASPGVLIYIDVDGLKRTNDRAGHAAGDELLRDAAGVLQRSFCTDETIARLGGDEFVVVKSATLPSEHPALLARLADELARYNAGGGDLEWSIGLVAIDPSAEPSLDLLMFEADRRMYAAKRAARPEAPRHHLAAITSFEGETTVYSNDRS